MRSEAYFKLRPRDAQIGAWASRQSSSIESRGDLVNQFETYQKKFASEPVPYPEFWGGYDLTPVYFEFWFGKENRLHERISYQRSEDGKWIKSLLAP